MTDLFSLDGKVALVTGAARGLGQAIAVGLAQAGADVMVSDVIDVSQTIRLLAATGRTAQSLTADVSKKSDVDNLVTQTVKQFHHIDILVNNAGILRTGPSETQAITDWEKVIAVNLTGQFLCAQAVGRQMIKQRQGRIINIASIAGIRGSPATTAYCASKGGIRLMTKALAVEWARHGILVNAVCPGIFVTEMTEETMKNEEAAKGIIQKVPLGRAASPEELVGTIVFLSSKASEYMTGTEVVVDGGWTAGL